uniref:Uncharacterized protein n=1 Tax=Anguilla anguilla TaxID=7936 RepID=A0A0E9S0I6_ANGAN
MQRLGTGFFSPATQGPWSSQSWSL